MSGDADPSSDGRLLLITARRWADTSRLALAARDAGFTVYLLAPSGHPMASLDWVHVFRRFAGLRPVRSVSRALNAMQFDLVVPADDFAAAAVFGAFLKGRLNDRAVSDLRRSLGDTGTFCVRHARATISAIAASGDVTAPRTWAVQSDDALPGLIATAGLPAVLKSDGSFGGGEVRVVDELVAARAAYRELARPPRLVDGVKWLLRERDAHLLGRSLLRKRRAVSVQEYVYGEPATLSAVAWNGEALGCIGFRVLRTRREHGPASIIEPIEHPDMERAAEVIARRLGLSGPFGLDFMISPDGSTASMLELNPRAAPTTHLNLEGRGRPLFHLLADRVGVKAPPPRPPLRADVFALFPQIVAADPKDNGVMPRVYLDVPEAPDVLDLYAPHAEERWQAPVARMVRRISSPARAVRQE